MHSLESRGSIDSLRFVTQVAGSPCTVRANWVLPIAEVLGFDGHLDASPSAADDLEADLSRADRISDLLDIIDSHLIAAPRPRRRRDRPVSSRAVFYDAGPGR